MNTFLTVWHYIVLFSAILLFAGTVYVIITTADKKLKAMLIIFSFIATSMVTYFIFNAIDKYTKIAELRNLKKTIMLSSEKVIYTGFVKNIGKYTIGNIYITIELVNKSDDPFADRSFYATRWFSDFFEFGSYKPQSIEQTFLVSTNLKPGHIKFFRVSVSIPTYFKQTTESIGLKAN
jgi:hypothetical protein